MWHNLFVATPEPGDTAALNLSRSVRTIFTLAAIGMALAAPVVSRNEHGEFTFSPKLSQDIVSRLPSGNLGKSAAFSAPVTPKLQEHNVLRLVDAMNVAFDDRRKRQQEGNAKSKGYYVSIANKADVKPLLTGRTNRPAWIVPDRRQIPVFPFIQP